MTTQEALAVIAGGGEVVDIGQLSRLTARHLQRLAKRGRLASDYSYHYPSPKRAYRLPALP